MVKSSEREDISIKPVNQEFLDRNGVEFHLGFYYSPDDFRTPTIDQNVELIEPLNINNKNPRQGSVWFMTKEADGKWYAKAVQIKRFTQEEYPILENLNSPILKNIVKNLQIFADPNSTENERLLARDSIEEHLYFPKSEDNPNDHTLLYKEVKEGDKVVGVQVSIKGIQNNIGEGLNLQEKSTMLLQLLQDERLNLRFQISPRKMVDSNFVKDLLESNIITTDLLQPLNVNASFDLYLNNLESGKPAKKKSEVPSQQHTGKRGVNSSLSVETVFQCW